MLLPHINAADAELEVWKHVSKDLDTDDNVFAAAEVTPDVPEYHTILKVLLTMTVSTSTAERTFSTLRRQAQNIPSQFYDERALVQFGFDGHSPWL